MDNDIDVLIPQRRSASQDDKLFSRKCWKNPDPIMLFSPHITFDHLKCSNCVGAEFVKVTEVDKMFFPRLFGASSVTRAVTISKLVSGDRKLYIGRLNVENIFLTFTIRGIWYPYRFLSPSQSREGFNRVEKQIILEYKVWISGYAAPPSSIAITSSLLHCARPQILPPISYPAEYLKSMNNLHGTLKVEQSMCSGF